MKNPVVSAVLGVALLASTTSAQAATRTMYISGSDLLAGGGATANPLGVTLPDGGTSSLLINLTLPQDFKPNSIAALQLRMGGGGTSCGITLAAAGAYRLRPGAVASVLASPASGLTIVSPATFGTPATSGQVFAKNFKLASPTAGTVAGQKTGDTVVAVIARDGGGAGDTCTGGLIVTSAKFTYTTP